MKTQKVVKWIAIILFHCIWFYLLFKFPDFSLFIVFLPIVLAINFIKNKRIQNTFISIFVIFWMMLFQYESLRAFYLKPTFKKNFPKTKFLFPPAGWIMFYQVGKTGGYYEVYGVKNKIPQLIDPHDIFRTRTIGYDNIHRGILGSVYSPENPHVAAQFCRYLNYRFDYFDKFYITGSIHPNIIEVPYWRKQQILYQCDDKQVRF